MWLCWLPMPLPALDAASCTISSTYISAGLVSQHLHAANVFDASEKEKKSKDHAVKRG